MCDAAKVRALKAAHCTGFMQAKNKTFVLQVSASTCRRQGIQGHVIALRSIKPHAHSAAASAVINHRGSIPARSMLQCLITAAAAAAAECARGLSQHF